MGELGGTHLSCGMGEVRRDVVLAFGWRVSERTSERRMASRGLAAREEEEEMARMARRVVGRVCILRLGINLGRESLGQCQRQMRIVVGQGEINLSLSFS